MRRKYMDIFNLNQPFLPSPHPPHTHTQSLYLSPFLNMNYVTRKKPLSSKALPLNIKTKVLAFNLATLSHCSTQYHSTDDFSCNTFEQISTSSSTITNIVSNLQMKKRENSCYGKDIHFSLRKKAKTWKMHQWNKST